MKYVILATIVIPILILFGPISPLVSYLIGDKQGFTTLVISTCLHLTIAFGIIAHVLNQEISSLKKEVEELKEKLK